MKSNKISTSKQVGENLCGFRVSDRILISKILISKTQSMKGKMDALDFIKANVSALKRHC